MEPGAHFQQGRNASPQCDPSFSGFGDPAQDFQERALPRAITSDNAHHFATFDLEADIPQGPKVLGGLPRGRRSEVGGRNGTGGRRSEIRGRTFRHLTLAPVSYTHLTLP